jgi:hypothetical protein
LTNETKNNFVTYWDVFKAIFGLLIEMIIIQVFMPDFLNVVLIPTSVATRFVFFIYCFGLITFLLGGWTFFSIWIELPYLLIKKYLLKVKV